MVLLDVPFSSGYEMAVDARWRAQRGLSLPRGYPEGQRVRLLARVSEGRGAQRSCVRWAVVWECAGPDVRSGALADFACGDFPVWVRYC